METIIPLAALASTAVVTPGPNNVIVMRRAAHAGVSATLPAITAIVVGGAAMLAIVDLGLGVGGTVQLARVAAIGGTVLLMAMAVTSWRHAGSEARSQTIGSNIGLVAFQLANPKAWILATTLAAAAETGGVSLSILLPMFAAISAAGLLFWASGGVLLRHILSTPARLRWFDRFMAALLFTTAVGLLMSQGHFA